MLKSIPTAVAVVSNTHLDVKDRIEMTQGFIMGALNLNNETMSTLTNDQGNFQLCFTELEMTFMDLAMAIISLTEFSLQGLIDFDNSLVAAFRQLGYTLKDCNPLS